MKNDRDVESLLRRYEPAGPPSELRARVVGARGDGRRRAWPWVAAAAALLIATFGLHVASARLSGTWVEPAVDARAQAIADLAEMLGGDEGAKGVAEQVIARDEDAQKDLPVGTSGIER
jgi:hypothetical protein